MNQLVAEARRSNPAHISTWVTDAEKRELEILARREHRTLAAEVRLALRQHVIAERRRDE